MDIFLSRYIKQKMFRQKAYIFVQRFGAEQLTVFQNEVYGFYGVCDISDVL